MEQWLFLAGTSGFALASISDLKTREVPDYLSYFLMGIGIVYRILWFALSPESGLNIILIPAILSGLFGLMSFFLYKTGQWGGGDVKLMVAAAWLIGYFPSRAEGFFGTLFFLNFFLNLIIFGTIYTILFTVGKGLRQGGISRQSQLMLLMGVIIGFVMLYFFKNLPSSLSLLVPITVMAGFGLPFFKEAEDKCFTKKVPVSKLTEGDWLVQEIEGVPKRGEGLTKKDIKKIKSKKLRKVMIKEGVPFIPAFLMGLVFTWAGIYFLPIPW